MWMSDALLSRRAVLGAGLAATVVSLWSPAADAAERVTIYRDPSCGCCEDYVAYLRRHGFDVTVNSAGAERLAAISRKAGIPPKLAGCHTAFVGGYAVDGLVPVAAVEKLLKDRPPLKGITLPGMPAGAPGMTTPKQGTLTVYAVPQRGKPTVFMTF
ncbi:MAG TPA: DUF411 domain-containing protein [Stellaceae bacterium]|nr:DUF411 domain-containing protein [Stellaceae bacterium]